MNLALSARLKCGGQVSLVCRTENCDPYFSRADSARLINSPIPRAARSRPKPAARLALGCHH